MYSVAWVRFELSIAPGWPLLFSERTITLSGSPTPSPQTERTGNFAVVLRAAGESAIKLHGPMGVLIRNPQAHKLRSHLV